MKSIKIAAVALFLLVSAYSAKAAEGTPADKLSEILKRGKLIIATDAANPPRSELIKGAKRNSETKCFSNEYVSAESKGFDPDVAIEVAKRLGLEACFVSPAWGEVISGGWADRWDIAFQSVSITSERMESLYYAQPYNVEPTGFYVHKDNTKFRQPSDLSGKKIGACAGCTFEYYLEGTLELPGQKIQFLVKNPKIIAYTPESKALIDLALGDGVKIDAVLTSTIVGSDVISNGMPIRQLGEPVFYSYIAPVIDKKHSRNPVSFVKKINDIIKQLHDDGTLSKLAVKSYGSKTDLVTPAKKFDIKALGQY